jgi:ElaB/YqjD/DUF883 family membrane-anchored ribosome-binding protein
MKEDKKHRVGMGIGVGSAVGVAIGFAMGQNTANPSQFIGLGLAIGVALGSLVDIWKRPSR